MPFEPPSASLTRRLDLRDIRLILPEFDVAVRVDEGTAVVAVRGELDVATARRLRTCLDDLRRAGHRRLRLEFADLAFCDVAGLSVLLHTARELRALDGQLVLADPPRSLQRILGVLRLDQTLQPRS